MKWVDRLESTWQDRRDRGRRTFSPGLRNWPETGRTATGNWEGQVGTVQLERAAMELWTRRSGSSPETTWNLFPACQVRLPRDVENHIVKFLAVKARLPGPTDHMHPGGESHGEEPGPPMVGRTMPGNVLTRRCPPTVTKLVDGNFGEVGDRKRRGGREEQRTGRGKEGLESPNTACTEPRYSWQRQPNYGHGHGRSEGYAASG